MCVGASREPELTKSCGRGASLANVLSAVLAPVLGDAGTNRYRLGSARLSQFAPDQREFRIGFDIGEDHLRRVIRAVRSA